MGTTQKSVGIGTALFGKVRRAVLALLFCHWERRFYLRQIVRAVGAGQGAVQRELARLTAVGLLVRTREGNQVYYQANQQSSIFAELKALMVKTTGVADVLREVMSELADRIDIAFLYGSLATGTDKATSDVDLMVIGDVTFAEVATAVHSTQETLGREVNPSVYPPDEFRKKVRAGHHFLKTVIQAPKVILIGDEHELARLGQKWLAD